MPETEKGEGTCNSPKIMRITDTIHHKQMLPLLCEAFGGCRGKTMLRLWLGNSHYTPMKHSAGNFGQFIAIHLPIGLAALGQMGAHRAHIFCPSTFVEKPHNALRFMPK